MDDKQATYVQLLKTELCAFVAHGRTVSDAAQMLRIDMRAVITWEKEDSEFKREIDLAGEACTRIRSDAILDLHLTCGDAKQAATALKAHQTWLGWQKPEKYGSKAASNLDTADAAVLLALIKEASRRILLHQQGTIDLQPPSNPVDKGSS